MGAHFRPESSSHAGKTHFFDFKKQGFHLPLFFVFFLCFWSVFGGLGVSFGILLEPLSSLWRPGVILSGAFGSPVLSVGSLCHFLWCLWLVWAVCGLGDRSRPVFLSIFRVFWDSFGSRSSFKRASRSLAKTGFCYRCKTELACR